MALALNGKWCNGIARCQLTAQAFACFFSYNDAWLSKAEMALMSMTHIAPSSSKELAKRSSSPCITVQTGTDLCLVV